MVETPRGTESGEAPAWQGATREGSASRSADGDDVLRGRALLALDDIELDLEDAPPFFRAAWSACRTIPPGETRSYRWLAAEAGNPRAVRAAGQAMARNRFVLIIPCHRVISSDGGLGGYGGGGLGVKAKLLQMELERAAEQ